MNITISTDKAKLNIPLIHKFLSEDSYWAKKIPLDVVARGIENSLNFGVYDDEKQIGYARVVTDYASFAYMADVFILQEYRGNGFSKRLVQFILEYPSLQGLRRWMLGTADAHALYQKYGFKELANPGRFLEIANPTIYENQKSD
jgi:GNAT superfamily N-acetyltransferase